MATLNCFPLQLHHNSSCLYCIPFTIQLQCWLPFTIVLILFVFLSYKTIFRAHASMRCVLGKMGVVFGLFFSLYIFWDRVAYISGWPQTCPIPNNDLVLLILLHLPPKEMLEFYVSSTIPSLYSTGDRTQGFEHGRQVFYLLSCILQP